MKEIYTVAFKLELNKNSLKIHHFPFILTKRSYSGIIYYDCYCLDLTRKNAFSCHYPIIGPKSNRDKDSGEVQAVLFASFLRIQSSSQYLISFTQNHCQPQTLLSDSPSISTSIVRSLGNFSSMCSICSLEVPLKGMHRWPCTGISIWLGKAASGQQLASSLCLAPPPFPPLGSLPSLSQGGSNRADTRPMQHPSQSLLRCRSRAAGGNLAGSPRPGGTLLSLGKWQQ